MTTLLIDAGNSRLKWGLYQHTQLDRTGFVSYPPSQQSSLLASMLGSSWSFFADGGNSPDRVVISNVAGKWVVDALTQWISEHLKQDLSVKDAHSTTIDTVIAQKEAFGVKNAYQQPDMLGADRWAALVAARHLVDRDCCIIDCGSALTIDVLTQAGEHKGGIIAPGWEMMQKSLALNTNTIDDTMLNSKQASSDLLGHNTLEAIDAGIIAACVGAVSHVVNNYQDENGVELLCVLTGGCANKLLPHLSPQHPDGTLLHEPDWVLKGLAIISDTMTEKAHSEYAGYVK